MMRRTAFILLLSALTLAACTSSGTAPRDPGKVVLPVKQVSVPGRLYATKGRTLYRFSGTHLTRLLVGTRLKDPAVTRDGARLAFAQLQDQSSTTVVADAGGPNLQSVTAASGPDGALLAFAPHYSDDGQQIVYLTDRGKQRSSPQNLQPNDLGVWSCDLRSGHSERLVAPLLYTGGGSDPRFRPGVNDQLFFTTYLYGGAPPPPVAPLTWVSNPRKAITYLSPDLARNFQ